MSESYLSDPGGQRPPRQGKSMGRGPEVRGLGEASRESQALLWPGAEWRGGRREGAGPATLSLQGFSQGLGPFTLTAVGRCSGKKAGVLGMEGGEVHEERVGMGGPGCPPVSCLGGRVSMVGAIPGRERMEDKFGGAVSSVLVIPGYSRH